MAIFHLFWRYLDPVLKEIREPVEVGPVNVSINTIASLIDILHPRQLSVRTLWLLAIILLSAGIFGLSSLSPFRTTELSPSLQNFTVRYGDGHTEAFFAGDLVKVQKDTNVIIEAGVADREGISCIWSTQKGNQHPVEGCAVRYSPPLGEKQDALSVLVQSPCKTQQTFAGLAIEITQSQP